MNQLQRIILINSGNVDFHELKLDGNIHFIGTQGTGKSTLLRAILFFYNADSRKLGISTEKEPFSQYYFPYADSYIFYEVKQGERRFCVWLYKKQNRLCFRFIDGPYEQAMFLNSQQALTESEIIEKANAKGYKVHRPIYNFTDYRDVIYGANRSMRRFSIIHNQSYHNIPRTISNIFLNSSLDGGFIKKTIINSLRDNTFKINLDKNRRHLETARHNYQDVSEYLKHERKAQNIVSDYAILLEQEEKQKELAWLIGAAYNKAKQKQHVTGVQEDEYKKDLSDQQTKINKIKTEHADNLRRVQDKLSVIKDNIATANKLVKDYESKNIKALLAEHGNENQYKIERSQINAQLELLKAGSKEVENQYQLSRQKLETECNQQVIDFEKSEQCKIDDLTQELSEAQKLFYEEKDKAFNAYQTKLEKQGQEQNGLSDELKNIDFDIKSISSEHYYQKEIDELKEQQQKLNLEKQQFENNANNALLKKESTTKEGKQQFELLDLKSEQQAKEFEAQKENLKNHIDTLQEDIDALSGSLLEFLEQKKYDWKNTIGKVVRKEFLLRNDLIPTIETGDNLYGLSVQLDDLKTLQLSKSDLDEEKKSKEQQLENLKNEIQKFNDSIQVEKDKKQKKYNKRIAELNDEIKTFNSKADQAGITIEKFLLAQKDFSKKSEEAKNDTINKKEQERHTIEKRLNEVEAYITSLKSERDKVIGELTKQFNTKEKNVLKHKKEIANEIAKHIESIRASYELKLEPLLKQCNASLIATGADINHISQLEFEISQLDSKLTFIKDNFETVIRYKKDCEEYIDRLSDFRLKRKSLDKEVEHKNYLYNKRLESETSIQKELEKKVNDLKHLLNELSIQLKNYTNFSGGPLFGQYRTFIEHHDLHDNWNCDELISKITNLALEYEKNDKSFAERITEFSGYFTQQNHLGFNTNLSSNSQYRAFAENLKEFVQEQKIIDYKTEVTKKYAMVLENIVAETKDLLENEKEVYKIIQRINSDFKSSNFVGVVKSIEMRLQESTNKIIQLLRKIQLFESENSMSFGEINLFNQGNSGKNDDEAVKLLESLLTQIGLAKTSKLSLEDAFDLEFRICENENDTNWVSRLANVGSNGTDVLVKSMIYINLLHIFKNSGKKQSSDTTLHCLIDEVGILHDSNVTGLITFAGERNIRLINGSPNSHNEQDYKHIYMFRKNKTTNKTGVTKLISNEL